MQSDHNTQDFFRPIAWATGFVLVGGLIAIGGFPLSANQRTLMFALIVGFGVFSFWVLRLAMARAWSETWIVYVVTVIHVLAIAIADYVVEPIDLSPLYTIVIIVVAVIAPRHAALFAASLVSVVQLFVEWLGHTSPEFGAGGLLRIGLYYLSALVVSQLTEAMTRRWQIAARQAEQQRQEIAQRKDELEGLHEIAQAFENLDDAPATFLQIAKRIAGLLHAEICILARFDESRSCLIGIPPGYGLTDEQTAHVIIQVDEASNQVWNVTATEFITLNQTAQLPPTLKALADQLDLRQIAAARLVRRDAPIGVVFVANKKNDAEFTAADGRLLWTLAGQAAIAVENAQLYRQLQATLQDVTRLYAVSTELAIQSRVDEIPRRVVNAVAEALNVPIATIALMNPATGHLEFAANIGLPAAALQVPFRPNGISMTVWRTRQPQFVEDVMVAKEVNPISTTWGYRAVACLPIQHGDQSIGVLYVNYAEPHVFSVTERNVLATFANQAAIALENARLYGEVQEQARRDSLTHVYNHGYFLKRLTDETQGALQIMQSFSLIMLDIDYFKNYNDCYGHVLGDKVLETLVQTIHRHIKHTDFVGRWGGEEFCIGLCDTDTAGAVSVAERIRETLAAQTLSVAPDQMIAMPTVSQGIATLPTSAHDTSTLIDRADAALYRAKDRGRDQICTAEGN